MSDAVQYLVKRLLNTKGQWTEVQRATGVSKRTFEKIAHGVTTNPKIETVEKLTAYFRERDAEYFRERDAA